MKKIIVIFSFFLACMFSTGSYFLHQIYVNAYKKECRNYILKHKQECSLITITIHPSEVYTNSSNIVWANDGKEIKYKGMLYDIVDLQNKGLGVELTVISDHWEMELNRRFLAIYSGESNKDTDDPFDLLKDFFELESIVNGVALEFKNSNNDLDPFYLSQSFQLITCVIPQETPPPDFFA